MILATRSGGNLERRSVGAVIPSRGAAYGAAVTVTNESAVGLPAVDAAIMLASQEVAGRMLRVWRGEEPDAKVVATTWQARLFTRTPNPDQSRFAFWETVEASLTARSNAYIWRTLDTSGRVVAWWALHPDQVDVEVATGNGGARVVRYRVLLAHDYIDPTGRATNGGTVVDVGEETILHVRGPHGGGRVVAPSPIARHRAAIGVGLAQQASQEGYYKRGTAGGHVIVFPQDLPARAAREAKALWDESNAGVANAYGTRVLSGGASIVPVTVSQSDAQFVETARLTIEDVGRIFRVPPSLLYAAAGVGAGAGPISPEHELTRWVRYGLEPRMRRIEDALAADPWLFGDGARDRPRFDRAGLISGDLATEATSDVQLVQAGILLADEARGRRGLPPLPGGVGEIPQITPVGGAPNPNMPPAPPPDQGDDPADQADQED